MSDDDVPVSALLGAAYEAVVHGQGLAAREAVELVKDLGFERNGTAKPFRFAYQHTEATEHGPQVRTVHATVPLLSLINPPSISIDSAKINMSLHLISQDIETEPAKAPTASGETPTTPKMPKLKGRIVHQSDKNAVMTIESTLKQRDLLASSRLSQLLDAAVSDRDSVWYLVLERAEPFRKAATELIDTVAQDGSKGKGVGVREWLQQLWELKEAVTDAVSAFRDGLPEKIPPLHQSWNARCQSLSWIDRHTEPEEMAALRRAFIAAASNVWQALLPGAQVAEFGPPTVEQLRDRFNAAVTALIAAPTRLAQLPERLHHLEGTVALGCTAHAYKQSKTAADALARYNETAAEIRKMWRPFAQNAASRAAQDGLAAAAESMWDALTPGKTVVDSRVTHRLNAEELEAEFSQTLNILTTQAGRVLSRKLSAPPPLQGVARLCVEVAPKALEAFQRPEQDGLAEYVIEELKKFNDLIDTVNARDAPAEMNQRPEWWRSVAQPWNEAARQFWGNLIDITSHPVAALVCPEVT
ncbi:DUF2589 domain-containing protein [Streptomyces sp. DH1]|uniref:DUF2589 domain-containing protein n=1 Tax=Streptomyces sp. DH1 TaxID=2857012 RepID=UPI001E433DA7|nr:DUF2589 domain-containing protein [Streptomyces sp. DH1]